MKRDPTPSILLPLLFLPPAFLFDENTLVPSETAWPFLLLIMEKGVYWVSLQAEQVSHAPGSAWTEISSSFLSPTLLPGPQQKKEKIKHSFRRICLRDLFLKAQRVKDITEFDLSPRYVKSERMDF